MNKKHFIFFLAIIVFGGCTKGSKVIARVSNSTITLKEFEARIKDMPESTQKYLRTIPGKKQFLDLLIKEKILYEEAKKQKINKREDIVRAVKKFKENYRKKMRDYEKELVTTTFLNELQEKQFVPDEKEILKYYQEHKKIFSNPVEYSVSHILVNNESEAKDVLKRLKNGEKFEELAREVSIDPQSNIYGGELGTFKRGELFPEFEEVLEKLPKGKISDIVKTSFGYHIIKKNNEVKLPAMDFENSKNEITKMILREKFDNWIENKKKEFNVKVSEEF